MKELEVAISLALAGLKLTPEQVELINDASIIDLIDMGLSFDEIENARAATKIESNRNDDKVYAGVTFDEGKQRLAQLLTEELGAMLDLVPLGAHEEILDLNAPSPDVEHDGITKQHLHTITQLVQQLQDSLAAGGEVPEWVQSHIAQAEQLLDNVAEYLEYKTLSSGLQYES